MIFAVIIFAAAGAPPVTYRSLDGFPTMAACEAHLAADMPRLEAVRRDAELSLGRELRMVVGCIDQGRGV